MLNTEGIQHCSAPAPLAELASLGQVGGPFCSLRGKSLLLDAAPCSREQLSPGEWAGPGVGLHGASSLQLL